MDEDTRFIRRALALAALAEGSVSPRPPVGSVVVNDGTIVGEGFTKAIPGPHAEAEALAQAGTSSKGATVYVTLEPCAKSSVSDACAHQLVASGVSRVVASIRDPNPDVNGRGFACLREAGIEVKTGPGRTSAKRLIEPFAKWVTTKQPFVTLKLAASLDGKVAAPDGTSQWITGEEARAEVHELRRRVDAVLVGASTVAIDDPSLTFRHTDDGTQPLRVVVDSTGRTPTTAKIFDGAAPALVITTDQATTAYPDVARVAAADGGVDLRAALEELGSRGICHVLCEGGPTLAASLVALGLVDRFVIYLAPKIIGGDAPGLFTSGIKTLADAWELRIESVTRVGLDLRIEAR
jgi:diaminohydroxyphosphoribosylaminopyrimidine deaminase/5-amino-6-(5-phosphoribosylamino)uracil reductase